VLQRSELTRSLSVGVRSRCTVQSLQALSHRPQDGCSEIHISFYIRPEQNVLPDQPSLPPVMRSECKIVGINKTVEFRIVPQAALSHDSFAYGNASNHLSICGQMFFFYLSTVTVLEHKRESCYIFIYIYQSKALLAHVRMVHSDPAIADAPTRRGGHREIQVSMFADAISGTR